MEHVVINIDSPCLAECAGLLVDRHRQGSAVDLSDVVVVLPGARAGRRLLELICELTERESLMLVPPRLLTPGQFRDKCTGYLNETESASDFEELTAWMCALQASTDLAGSLFPHSKTISEDTDWFSLAETLRGVYSELAGDGISMQQVAAYPFEDESEQQRWQTLERICSRYLATLADTGLSDRYSAADIAIQLCKSSPEAVSRIFPRITAFYVIGIVDIFGRFRDMLDILSERIVVVSHGKKEWFDAHGMLGRDPAPDFGLVDAITDRCIFCDTPADQARRSIHIISELKGKHASSDIILAAPDAEVIRPLQQMLEAAGIPCHDAVGQQFSQTELGSLTAVISEYIDTQTVESLLRLLHHPVIEQYLSTIETVTGSESEYKKVLYALQEHASEYIVEYTRKNELRLLKEKGTEGVTDSIELLHSLFSDLETPRRLNEWPDVFNRMFEKLYSAEGETAADRLPAHHHEAVSLWLAECEEIRTARIEWDKAVSAGMAFRRILKLLATNRIVPESMHNAIDIVGWLELALDDVPVVIVTGLNEGIVPQSITSHPFLPNRLRTAFGLLNNERRFNRDRYTLRTIMHSSETCWFIAGRSSNSADPYMPSRLLFDLAPKNQAAVVNRFFGEEKKKPVEMTAPVVPTKRIKLEPPSDEKLSLPNVPQTFAVSEFRNYLACPYMYYLGKMKIRSAPTLQTEMDPMQFGILIHRVLEKFGTSGLITSDRIDTIAEFLNKTVEKLIYSTYGNNPHPAVLMQAVSCRNRLVAFAVAQVAELEAGWRMERVEESFEQELSIDGISASIRGRIDRIDRRGDAFRLLDYKTGSTVNAPDAAHYNKRREEWLDLQLPLYAWSVMRSGKSGTSVPEVGYFAIPSKVNEVKPMVVQWDEEFIEKACRKAGEIIDRVQNGGKDVFRRTDDVKVCRNCEYRYVCQR